MHQYTCKSLTEYGTQSRGQHVSLRPNCDPKIWKTYSYCDTAEGMKQTVHLYYWFRV